QAEDGIRDRNVTGVQTCALPISSRNKIVVRPDRSRLSNACSITRRTSLTPEDIADSSTNFRSGACEITCAKVVFPVPGGPYKINEDGPMLLESVFSVSFRNGEPCASRCCWPTISSKVRGRIRTTKGAPAADPAVVVFG